MRFLNKKNLIVLVLFTFSSCSLFNRKELDSLENMVSGFKEMMKDIEDHSQEVKKLKGKSYLLTVKSPGKWKLKLHPKDSFKIKRLGREKFKVKLKNVEKLFDYRFGLFKRVDVEGELIRVGMSKGEINISPEVRCIFPVSFYLPNGQAIDFSRLEPHYQSSFTFSDPRTIKLKEVTKKTAYFERPTGSSSKGWVRLILKNKMHNHRVEVDEKVYLPSCQDVSKDSGEESELKEERKMEVSPNECLSYVRGTPSAVYHQEKDLDIEAIFMNRCEWPVTCKLSFRYALVTEGKLREVKDDSFYQSFDSKIEEVILRHHTFPMDIVHDYKLFSWQGTMKGFSCTWKK